MRTTPQEQPLVIADYRPGKLVWFPLLVLFSSWYSVILLAWWLSTPTPDFSFPHYDGFVHFGVMTGTLCLWIQMFVTQSMPKMDRHFYLCTAVSTFVVFACAFWGPGSRFSTFDLREFRYFGSWPNDRFVFQTLLSLLAVLLLGIVIWVSYGVVFNSIRFSADEFVEERNGRRARRLVLAVVCVLAMLPVMALLRETYAIYLVPQANLDAYKYWLFKVFIAGSFLWGICRVATLLQSSVLKISILIVLPWLAWSICWAWRSELQRYGADLMLQSLLGLSGFLLHWTASVITLSMDQLGFVVETPQLHSRSVADPERELFASSQVSECSYLAAFPPFLSLAGFVVAVLVGNRFPVYFEPITLISPQQSIVRPSFNDRVSRAHHIAGLWQCSSGEPRPDDSATVVGTLKIRTGSTDDSWSLTVPIERAIDSKFINHFSSIENINLTVFVTAEGSRPHSDLLRQINEIRNDAEELEESRMRDEIMKMQPYINTRNQ